MPIRINLLAEQQAAEDARRRDPVKRAIWVGSGLIALMLIWGISLELEASKGKSDLAKLETSLQAVEERAKTAKTDKQTYLNMEKDLASLEKYAASKFLWGNALDAIQKATVDKVRIIEISADQHYLSYPESKTKTNLVTPFKPSGGWALFGNKTPAADVMIGLTNQIASITNRLPYSTNKIPALVKIGEMTTNSPPTEVTSKIELIIPPTANEQVVLEIRGRDYSSPLEGKQALELMKKIATIPYFQRSLVKESGVGISLKDRGIQPEDDPVDPLDPAARFITFWIECRFDERVFTQ